MCLLHQRNLPSTYPGDCITSCGGTENKSLARIVQRFEPDGNLCYFQLVLFKYNFFVLIQFVSLLFCCLYVLICFFAFSISFPRSQSWWWTGRDDQPSTRQLWVSDSALSAELSYWKTADWKESISGACRANTIKIKTKSPKILHRVEFPAALGTKSTRSSSLIRNPHVKTWSSYCTKVAREIVLPEFPLDIVQPPRRSHRNRS